MLQALSPEFDRRGRAPDTVASMTPSRRELMAQLSRASELLAHYY